MDMHQTAQLAPHQRRHAPWLGAGLWRDAVRVRVGVRIMSAQEGKGHEVHQHKDEAILGKEKRW